MKAKVYFILLVASLTTNFILFDAVTGKESVINEQYQKIKQLQKVGETKVNTSIETYCKLK